MGEVNNNKNTKENGSADEQKTKTEAAWPKEKCSQAPLNYPI